MEQPTNPVEDFRTKLSADKLSKEQLFSDLSKLTDDVREKNIKMSREQLTQLRAETTKELQETAEREKWDKAITELAQRELEIRQQAIEQQAAPDSSPKFVQQAKNFFSQNWDRMKGGVTAVGEFLGVTVPEKAGEAWNFMVKWFWKLMASPTDFGMQENFFTKFAREKVNKAEMWEGMRDFADTSKLINLEITEQDCVQKYQQLLPILSGFPGISMYEKASNYLREYLRQKHPKAEAKNKVRIDLETLITANLVPMVQLSPPIAPSAPTAAPGVAPQQTVAPVAAPATQANQSPPAQPKA